MIPLVPDASVGVKWALREEHSAAAERLLAETYTLHVPELFYVEVGNVFWKRVGRGR